MSVLLLLPARMCRGWASRGSRVLCAGGVRMQCVGKVGDMRPTPESSVYTSRAPARLSSQGPTEPAAKEPGDAGGGEKPNKTQQLKRVFKEYGGVAVTFHVGISLVSLGIFYALVSSGLDVPALLLKVGFSEALVQSKMAAGTSTFVLAYAIHKLFAPVRMSITVVSVPFLVRYFRRIGFFKPPPPRA